LIGILLIPAGQAEAQDTTPTLAGEAAVRAAPIPRQAFPVIKGEEEPPVIAMFTSGWSHMANAIRTGDPAYGHPRIIVAVWKDGRIIWSKDTVLGGVPHEPYSEAKIDPDRIKAALSALASMGAFQEDARNRLFCVPDSVYTAIAIRNGNQWLNWVSGHEIVSQNPRIVATRWGIEPLRGRSREGVLASQPEDYRHFRGVWDKTKQTLLDLIPKETSPKQGLYDFRNKILPKVDVAP